jgi:uncharacterized membrane protein HdeD (DUF308 family)
VPAAAVDPPSSSGLSGAWTVAWVAGILLVAASGLWIAVGWVRRRQRDE